MIAPNITLSGTAQEVLLDGYCEARVALRTALMAERKITPHPRDYLGSAEYEAALAEHKQRLKLLQEMFDEYTIVAADVICQQDAQQKEGKE